MSPIFNQQYSPPSIWAGPDDNPTTPKDAPSLPASSRLISDLDMQDVIIKAYDNKQMKQDAMDAFVYEIINNGTLRFGYEPDEIRAACYKVIDIIDHEETRLREEKKREREEAKLREKKLAVLENQEEKNNGNA